MTNHEMSKNILPGVYFSGQLPVACLLIAGKDSTPNLVIKRAFSHHRQGISNSSWRYEYAHSKKSSEPEHSSLKTLKSRTLVLPLQRKQPDANLNSHLFPNNLDSQIMMRGYHYGK